MLINKKNEKKNKNQWQIKRKTSKKQNKKHARQKKCEKKKTVGQGKSNQVKISYYI